MYMQPLDGKSLQRSLPKHEQLCLKLDMFNRPGCTSRVENPWTSPQNEWTESTLSPCHRDSSVFCSLWKRLIEESRIWLSSSAKQNAASPKVQQKTFDTGSCLLQYFRNWGCHGVNAFWILEVAAVPGYGSFSCTKMMRTMPNMQNNFGSSNSLEEYATCGLWKHDLLSSWADEEDAPWTSKLPNSATALKGPVHNATVLVLLSFWFCQWLAVLKRWLEADLGRRHLKSP